MLKQFERVKPVSVIPTTSGYEQYPFSLSFLLQCYCRCLGRDNHPTMSNEDPLTLFKIFILFYSQFKGKQLKSLVEDYIQVEMTTAARLPTDLEFIMAEAVSSGLEFEDALEDAVSKIEQYRQLFGTGQTSGSNRNDFSNLNKIIDQVMLTSQVVEEDKELTESESEEHHHDSKKHVVFTEKVEVYNMDEHKKVAQ